MRLAKFWTGRSLLVHTVEWHHTVHVVLKEFVFVRLLALGVPLQLSRLVTFVFSAFWHGLHSGYYFLTIVETVMAVVDEFRLKHFTPNIAKLVGEYPARVFDSVFVNLLSFWIGAPWDLYWASRYIKFYISMQCGPLLIDFAFCAIGFVLPRLMPGIFGTKAGKRGAKHAEAV
jgi:D-alanyl-lipoteichoic acid acyltransferase DltB (MBOAT superfamily)